MSQKIKIPKLTKEQRMAKAKESIRRQQLAVIKAKYDVKVQKTMRKFADKTWAELWVALDILKEEMRKELEAIGIK